MRNIFTCNTFALIYLVMPSTTLGSLESNGPNGIDALGLGLTGNNVGIGMVESGRPGDPTFDTNAALFNNSVDPAGVFYTRVGLTGTTFNATADLASESNVDMGHSTDVASVMISTTALRVGTSPQAMLFGGGDEVGMFQDPLDISAVTSQHIVTRNAGNIAAVNMSFGFNAMPGELGDGQSVLSSFVDWSAKTHDSLYVVAGAETGVESYVLVDNFNGMTIGYSEKGNGVFRKVGSENVILPNPVNGTDRTYVDLIAPGDSIQVAGAGGTNVLVTGTSYAAPHVSGSVALLQEYANTQQGNNLPRWDSDSNRHETMKAVLMNSADKVSGRLGSTRTVLKKNNDTWDNSDAAFDSLLPLDEEMGAGHLNVSRAITQFSSGEYDPDMGTVPVIGWDYDNTTGNGDINKYVLNQEIPAGSYLSVTLAWDREVTFDSDGGTAGQFDSGDTFDSYSQNDADDVMNDLDIVIMPKGATDPFNDFIWESRNDHMPLEHLFVPIDVTGEYEIWVTQEDADVAGGQDYGIAWWTVGTGPLISGDFDGDGNVDGADLAQWQGDYGLNNMSDADGDGDSDGTDFLAWQRNFTGPGALGNTVNVPEPSYLLLLLCGSSIFVCRHGSLGMM